MSLKIKACDPDNPYGEAITSFMAREFPANLDKRPVLLDALTDAFVASGQIRQGAAPNPESLVELRRRISYFIDANLPIQVIVPWGSRKPNNGGVDVAELFAIKQLVALDQRVRTYYPQGTTIAINAEDTGGFYLWPELDPTTIDDYTDQLRRLVHLVSNGRLMVTPESSFTTYTQFEASGEAIRPYIEDVLLADNTTERQVMLERLHDYGWVGDLPDEQVNFYLRQYAKLYPNEGYRGHLKQLARYYAQAFACYKTSARGPNAGRAVFINYQAPVPGAPESLFLGRMFYRTLPTKYARTHLPPWRAKGYLLIDDKGGITPKLATHNETISGINTLNVELTGDAESVKVGSDFVVEG